jgi:hypothetical protein
MIYNRLSMHTGHYAVNPNTTRTGVLLQIMDEQDQVRILMAPTEVDHLIELLQKSKHKVNLNEAC